MTAPDAIHELVAKFDQHRKEYQTHKNETELWRELQTDDMFQGCVAHRLRFSDVIESNRVHGCGDRAPGLSEETVHFRVNLWK